MATALNPYISFKGNAREAMEFYRSVFGGELTLNTFGDMPGADPATAEQIMHADLVADNGFRLMASDTPPGMDYNPGDNISISLSGEDGDSLRGYWDKLSGAGQINMPLEKQMWGDEFGMLTDRYGINWMVNITQAAS